MDRPFNEKLSSLLAVDKIRFYKLAELSQYSILTIMISLYIGKFVNRVMPDYTKDEDPLYTWLYVMINVVLFVISWYYIRKILTLVPFVLSFDKDYTPSRKAEYLIGFSVGFSLSFGSTQTKLKQRIQAL